MASPTPDPSPDSLLRSGIGDVDEFVAELVRREEARQDGKLILIPSESYAPKAVREALGSVFQNIYAEGYPPVRMARDSEARLRDVDWQLASYRRYADRRFYKGVEYADLVECLAQRRCAELFAHGDVAPEHIQVNVQPLSGAAANLAVYWALMEPGDCLMGLDLYQGGHLTHGSQFNISGRRYRVTSYGVDGESERLDYEVIREQAHRHRPRVIVGGYTSYPWAPDWKELRAIADEVGAYLLADIAHTAGMATAGAYPNPLGIADVTTFTTHKTICGPRGACIITTDEDLAHRIDMAVFPGEQGGPHVNKFAAMAVAFELASTERFRLLQRQIVANAAALSRALDARGLRLAYGGTDTHLLLVDLKSLPARHGWPIYGEPAVRILDLAGIVANKNTIPGDTATSLATGVRLGTPWITQRGLDERDMGTLGELIYRLLSSIHPFVYHGLLGTLPRGKVELSVLRDVSRGVAELAGKADASSSGALSVPRAPAKDESTPATEAAGLLITGWRARQFVQEVVTANVASLAPTNSAEAYLLDGQGKLIAPVVVSREESDEWGRDRFSLSVPAGAAGGVAERLKALSDGYTLFDDDDVFRKVEGPVTIEETIGPTAEVRGLVERARGRVTGTELYQVHPAAFDLCKPYFIGQSRLENVVGEAHKPPWCWVEPEHVRPTLRTPLAEEHRSLGARMMPFVGWEMPLWYTSVGQEHRAVREAAGLFDVGHMGVFEVEGPNALALLDAVFSNYAAWLDVGQSSYGYLLDPDAQVIDDVIVYRRRSDCYLLVVNAVNETKDWDWLNATNERRVCIDRDRPWIEIEASAVLRNLKDPAAGERQLRDMALQGPASLATLLAVGATSRLRDALVRLRRTELVEGELGDVHVTIARTGYTGEERGYELLVHPSDMVDLWRSILDVGTEYGVVPAGLGARDSTRTEAGLPLYGHELAGPYEITPIEAGFAGYVKYHKPFFIGRDALIAQEHDRARQVLRFRVDERNVRPPRLGDPVLNSRGQQVGNVTSCSTDSTGHLLGMAIADSRCNVADTPIVVCSLGGRSVEDGLLRGGRVNLPAAATVLPRFPGRAGATHMAGE